MPQTDPQPDPPSGVPTPADLAARLATISREIRLPDDALVMRGGTLQRSDLEKAVLKAKRVMHRAGLTVYAADVNTPGDLYNLKPLPHAQLCFTTAGRLREAGFELEQTFETPHYTAWLPPDDEEDEGFWLQMFCRAFDQPVPRADVAKYGVSEQ